LPQVTQLRVVSTGPDQPSDADLLARAGRKDSAAFSILVERHFSSVYRVVWRMLNGHSDAEDVTQEAFLRLWRNPAQVREAAALKGWLMRVASNIVMDRFRGPREQAMGEDFDVADGRDTAEEQLSRSQAVATVDEAVASLPDRQKLALTLVHFEQLPQGSAAEIMEISVDALESLLARARRSLKARLAPNKTQLLASLAAERT
jgi:RNA polymerase sigma-70 factor (ECF subfamily)